MSETTTTRKRGPKWPPEELLAAALLLYTERPHLTLDQLPALLQKCAKRGGFDRWAEKPVHPNTLYNWKNKAIELGLKPEDAGPLFQVIREVEG